MNNRVPNGNRRRSTDTTSLEEGRPDAVTPGPVWQVTSKTPSEVPGLLADLAVGAPEVVGAGDVAAASAPVDAAGAVGVPVLWQPPSSTAPASATVGRTRVVQRVMLAPICRSRFSPTDSRCDGRLPGRVGHYPPCRRTCSSAVILGAGVGDERAEGGTTTTLVVTGHV